MPDLKQLVADRVADRHQPQVWTPADFLDLGNRDAVDKVLQRLARSGQLRRLCRGLYGVPRINVRTNDEGVADYRQIVDALARRDQLRMLVDGLTAANDLGLTNAMPSRVVIHTDARRRAVQVDDLTIDFKRTAPSKLYWAGRPAMRIVQALHWLKDTLPADHDRIIDRLTAILSDPVHGAAMREDLRIGLVTLPAWMQRFVRSLINSGTDYSDALGSSSRSRPRREMPTRRRPDAQA